MSGSLVLHTLISHSTIEKKPLSLSLPTRSRFSLLRVSMASTGSYYGDETSVPGRRPGPYPFQLFGPRTAYEVKKVKEGLFVRVDMPGVEEDEVDVFVKDSTVFFRGDERKEYTDDPRTYHGSFGLSSHSDQFGELKTQMKNGVLRILVPAGEIQNKYNNLFSNPPSSFFTQFSEGMYSANNPFLCSGRKTTFEKYLTTDGNTFLRVDMPGVEKKSVKIWVEGNMVYFIGEAPKLWEGCEANGRTHAGKYILYCESCRIEDNVMTWVENGVVRMEFSTADRY